MRRDTDMTSTGTGRGPGRRRTWTSRRSLLLLAVVPTAAIAAACGSSSTTSSTTPTKAPSSTSSGSAAASIQSANNAKFGAILVDAQGRTLYTLTNNGKAVACTGGCLSVWPAALLPAGVTKVTPGSGVSNVTAVAASGGQQLVYNGLPLYRFSGDSSAGAANGNGINSFGGIWNVVKISGGGTGAAGGTATTSGSGTSGTTTTTSGGGGGY